MSEPTLREVMECWERQDYLPSRQADKICQVMLDIERRLYWWSMRVSTTYSDDGTDSYESGRRDVAKEVWGFLDKLGFGDLRPPTIKDER